MLVVLLLAAGLMGCHTPAEGSSRATASEIKLYKVPTQDAKQVEGALGVLLASNGKTGMGVTQPFPGTLMVLAPPHVQANVASVIATLAKSPIGSARSEPLQVHFWLVAAVAGHGTDDPALRPLSATLQRLRASLGPTHFLLEDSAAIAVDAPDHNDVAMGNGSVVTSRGRRFAFHAVAAGRNSIALKVHYFNTTPDAASRTLPELNTMIATQPGDYVVLAEAPPAAGPTAGTGATVMNLLVTRVDRMTTAAP
jgi:hypothetical protein